MVDPADESWQYWLDHPRERSFYSTEDVYKAGFLEGLAYSLEDPEEAQAYFAARMREELANGAGQGT